MLMMVLLKVALMWAVPLTDTFRSFFFFVPLPLATIPPSTTVDYVLVSFRRPDPAVFLGPFGSGHWSWCAGRSRAARGDAAIRGSTRYP